MSDFYTRLRDKTTKRTMDKYGDLFRITSTPNSTFNPATGEVVSSSVTQDVKGKAFSIEQKFDTGELVETSKIEIYLAADSMTFEPKEGMSIKCLNVVGVRPWGDFPWDGYTPLQISNVQRIPESGIAVLYRVIAVR